VPPPTARRLVTSATRAFASGVALERRILEEGGSLEDYREAVKLRTAWFHVAGLAWLESSGVGPAPRLGAGLEGMMLGLQLADDAVDAAEDERTRGRSFTLALGMRREVLLALSGLSLDAAATALAQPGSVRLSQWCRERARAFRKLLGQPQAALGWTIIATPLAASLHLEADGPRRCDQRRSTPLPRLLEEP
jgi:hypothetical protein